MSFTKGMSTRDERNGFFIIHRHTAKGFANIMRGSKRIRITVRPLRIHGKQSHLYGSQRIF